MRPCETTLNSLPNRVTAKTDIPLPKRAKLRNDMLLPPEIVAKALRAEPRRTKERTLRLLPTSP